MNITPKTRSILFIALPIACTIVLSIVLQAVVSSKPEMASELLASFGPYFLVGYILLQSLTIIIAPIGGGFLQVALIALLGPERALVLTYIVVTPAYLINFWIARRYGKRVVSRIIGSDALSKLDSLIQDSGTLTLVVLKVFQGGNFDYISYVYGLSSVEPRIFFWVNLFAGIPSLFLAYYLYSAAGNLVAGVGVVYVVSSTFGIIALLSIRAIKKYRATHRIRDKS